MNTRWVVALSVLAGAVAGCGSSSPLLLKARFNRIGVERGHPVAYLPVVKTADAVAVHYGSSPPGFSLRENELMVEPGYKHEILGMVSVGRGGDYCSDSPNTTSTPHVKIVQLLRQEARAKGADALIYVSLDLSEDATAKDLSRLCFQRGMESYARGWAVSLATPTAPVEPAVP